MQPTCQLTLPVGTRWKSQKWVDVFLVKNIFVIPQMKCSFHRCINESFIKLPLAKHQKMIRLSPLPSVVQGPRVADVVPLVQDAHQGRGSHSFLASFLHHVGLKIDMYLQVSKLFSWNVDFVLLNFKKRLYFWLQYLWMILFLSSQVEVFWQGDINDLKVSPPWFWHLVSNIKPKWEIFFHIL